MPNIPVPAAGTALPADPFTAAKPRFDEVLARIDALHEEGDFEALRLQHARERFELAIERMIAMLDAVEPDGDLEPSLGWTVQEAGYGGYVATDDREHCHGDSPEEDPAELGLCDLDALWEADVETRLVHNRDLWAGEAREAAASELARLEHRQTCRQHQLEAAQ